MKIEKRIEVRSSRRARMVTDDVREMRKDMIQAGWLAKLEYGDDWQKIDNAITVEFLRWSYGIRKVRSRKDRRDRHTPLHLETLRSCDGENLEWGEFVAGSDNVEENVYVLEVMRKLEDQIREHTTDPESYWTLIEQWVLHGSNHLPNGVLKSIGLTGSDGAYRKQRILKWVRAKMP